MADSFWNQLHDASASAEGFTVTFYMKGGHVLRDVAILFDISDCIEGGRITSSGDRVPVVIRTADVVAYEIEP